MKPRRPYKDGSDHRSIVRYLLKLSPCKFPRAPNVPRTYTYTKQGVDRSRAPAETIYILSAGTVIDLVI